MNHRSHTQQRCLQSVVLYLYFIIGPLIISGQSLQKHSCTNIHLSPSSSSCSSSASLCSLLPRSLVPAYFPSLFPVHPDPLHLKLLCTKFYFLSCLPPPKPSPTFRLPQCRKHNHLFILLVLDSSTAAAFPAKNPTVSRDKVLCGSVARLKNS